MHFIQHYSIDLFLYFVFLRTAPVKKRTKKDVKNIEDVYDGKLYRSHFGQDGFFKGTDDAAKANEIHLSLHIITVINHVY